MKNAMSRMVLAALFAVAVVDFAKAGPFGLFGRRSNGNAAPAQAASNTGYISSLATAQDAAYYMARIRRIGHFGGNRYAAEGVGMGGSPDAAIRNCCFYGRRQIAEQGVAQGADGMWYACCRYW